MPAMAILSTTLLIPPRAMAEIDAAAAASGLDSYGLMSKAGHAVASAALAHWPQMRRAAVLCGPGNNGGDGYVAARLLAQAGVPVALHALGDPAAMAGDARRAFTDCPLPVAPLEDYGPEDGDLVIDALFGAGLTRDVPEIVRSAVATVEASGVPVLAVDLPSGIDGATGRLRGTAFRATRTITFMARKPGHLLLPGRVHAGAVEVVDIGIPWRFVAAGAIDDGILLAENHPEYWAPHLPVPQAEGHKFSRGHLAVFSGPAEATGAARLSAKAGLRLGAGLVTLLSPPGSVSTNAAQLTAVMLRTVDDDGALEALLADRRLSAFVLGPGFGIGERARRFALALSERALVLDADGISSFRDDPVPLFDAFAGGDPRLVLTPHEGEFGRLFPDLAQEPQRGKLDLARAAARRAHAVVVYKGADTVIAAPDGRCLINANAPPWLATAGSGDVLAGIIGGFLAQGVPAFEAAAAGVWLHGETANGLGPGLTAETLADAVRPYHPLAEGPAHT